MAHYKVILAYDGTDFAGFQRQSEAVTVQGEVETALHSLGWGGSSIRAAGRTDAGVHARGQVISFFMDWNHPDTDLQKAMNAKLPAEISARSIKQTAPDFHPRYDAVSRTYRYMLNLDPVKDPLQERFAWRTGPRVDKGLMKKAGMGLIGQHDFVAFGRAYTPEGSTVREVKKVDWSPTTNGLAFEITANAFLYHMVRRIVNLLVDIGRGKHAPDIVRKALTDPASDHVTGLAPPQGLCLKEVGYPEI